MLVNLTIPDELYSEYKDKFGSPQLYLQMKRALDTFAKLEKNDRFIVISGEDRRKLESIFDTPIENPTDLVKKCQKLNNFKIGEIGISFTADELARIDAQAAFFGEDRETFLTRLANTIKGQILESV